MIKTKNLNLPKPLNLSILESLLSQKALDSLIYTYANKSRKERRIILPTQMCLKKCLIHYLVNKYHGDFKKALELLRDKEGILAWKGLHIGNLKRMYFQRCKEIEKEQREENE
ncbi:MAG: hypothetical protein KAT65_03910 [Methanophagales archaeon]|nr:hypothetical protein [Methanophagales archaeon]